MKDMTNIITVLINKYGLGELESDILPVSGGLMHRMFKVKTSTGEYAVKCLNPEIMNRPNVFENYAKAEKLERVLEERGLPIVPALEFGGKKMLEADGRYFYVFRWQEGQITDWNNISKEQCFRAGEILGRIHGIDMQASDRQGSEDGVPHGSESLYTRTKEATPCKIDFGAYLEIARGTSSHIAEDLEKHLNLLEHALSELNRAREMLPHINTISDDDMDPKNIMWHEGKPYVIDLECLDYGNPVASSLNLALQWSGTVNGRFSKENLEAFYRGYLGAYDNGFRSYGKIFGIAYTWVEWLEYNIRRALKMEGTDEEEIRLGEAEVRNTIDRIEYLESLEGEIQTVLMGVSNKG